MDISTTNVLVSGVIGLISGGVGSLIAPWVQWGIEKRKSRLQKKIDYISKWRLLAAKEEFDRMEFMSSPEYQTLRTFLRKGEIKQLERSSSHYIIDINATFEDPDKRTILAAIARVEKKWRLI